MDPRRGVPSRRGLTAFPKGQPIGERGSSLRSSREPVRPKGPRMMRLPEICAAYPMLQDLAFCGSFVQNESSNPGPTSGRCGRPAVAGRYARRKFFNPWSGCCDAMICEGAVGEFVARAANRRWGSSPAPLGGNRP